MNKLDTAAPHCGISGRTRLLVLLFLMICAVIAQWFVSIDNPWRHSLYGHIDSAMFFMAGKAWANGMIPYVDFSDSKGPVLWLINMIAYWISPTNYAGVMVMSMIFLGFSLYFAWLTACRIIGDKWLALWATAPMIFMWLWAFGHSETRAETYAQLPIIYLYYVMATGMKDPNLLNRRTAIISGICLMSMLLIKWTFFFLGGIFVVAQLVILYSNKQTLSKYILNGCLGMLMLGVPIFIYLLCVGAFIPFFREYFFTTSATIANRGDAYLHFVYIWFINLVTVPAYIIMMLMIFIGNILPFIHSKKVKWLPIAVTILFLAGTILTSNFFYYLQLLAFLFIGFFAWLVAIASRLLSRKIVDIFSYAYVLPFAIILVIAAKFTWTYNPLDDQTPERVAFKNIDLHLVKWSQTNNNSAPKIMYIDGLDFGVGITTNALPATKYWFRQNSATLALESVIKEEAASKKADFLLTKRGMYSEVEIASWGYTKVYQGGKENPYLQLWQRN